MKPGLIGLSIIISLILLFLSFGQLSDFETRSFLGINNGLTGPFVKESINLQNPTPSQATSAPSQEINQDKQNKSGGTNTSQKQPANNQQSDNTAQVLKVNYYDSNFLSKGVSVALIVLAAICFTGGFVLISRADSS